MEQSHMPNDDDDILPTPDEQELLRKLHIGREQVRRQIENLMRSKDGTYGRRDALRDLPAAIEMLIEAKVEAGVALMIKSFKQTVNEQVAGWRERGALIRREHFHVVEEDDSK